jgi:2,3-bisphosphoglycerate-dependent phosphoglycerate mutase
VAKIDRERRKRRRIRRLIYIVMFVLVVTSFAWFLEMRSTTTVMIVRHAEVEQGVENPGLSPAGRLRAKELVRLLGDVDVTDSVDAVFATRWRRTQETAEPLARHVDTVLQIVNPAELEKLQTVLLDEYKGQVILLVLDANDLQPVVAQMKGSKVLRMTAPGEHDSLYVLSVPWFGKVKTLQFHYGRPYIGPKTVPAQ